MNLSDKVGKQAINSMEKAIQGIEKIIAKICIAFVVSVTIISICFSSVLIYKDYKAYDYEYEVPDFENVNINGDSNSYGKDD